MVGAGERAVSWVRDGGFESQGAWVVTGCELVVGGVAGRCVRFQDDGSAAQDVFVGGGGVAVTTFAYDDECSRVRQTAGQGEQAVTTTYLIDDNNFTGYSQTLEQTERDSSQTLVRKTTYAVGADVHGQYVTTPGGKAAAVFLTDGRGSTRGLYEAGSSGLRDAAQVSPGGAWTKVLSYDAFGNAVGFEAATAGTETATSRRRASSACPCKNQTLRKPKPFSSS